MAGRGWMRGLAGCAVLAATTLGTGCGNFFQCEGKASCGGSGVSDTGDVVYATNRSSTALYAYYLGTDGSLNNISGSPYTMQGVPSSMLVAQGNGVLYVSNGTGITSWNIASGGALSGQTTAANSGEFEVSMVETPNKSYLLALDLGDITTGQIDLRVYSVSSTGALTSTTNGILIGYTSTLAPTQLAISPDGSYVAVSLGLGGTQVFNFNQSNGTFTSSTPFYANTGGQSTIVDNAVAFDSADNLYIGRVDAYDVPTSAGVVVYSITGKTLITTKAVGTGLGLQAMAFSPSYGYLYTANKAANTLTQFSDSSGTLTSLGSDVAGPTTPQAVAVDSSGDFVVAQGANSGSSLETFTIGTGGTIAAAKTATIGSTAGIPLIAVTH